MRLLLCGRRLFLLALLLAASGGPATAQSYGAGSAVPYFDGVVDWMGFHDLSGDRRDLLSFCLFVYAIVFGVLTNFAFRDRGFGIFLNGVLGVVGICLGLYFCGPHFRLLPPMQENVLFNVIAITACLGSAVFLVIAALVKGVTVKLMARFLDGFDRPEKPKPVGLHIEPLPPRIASALRKQ